MKLVLMVTFVSLLSFPALAESDCTSITDDTERLACFDAGASRPEASATIVPGSPQDACAAMGALASAVLTGRQKGVAMSAMLAATLKGQPDAAAKIIRMIVTDGYGLPQLRSPENVKSQNDEFRNKWEVDCYKSNQ